MDTDRIRQLLLEIHDTEQRLAGLRAELARLVAEKVRANSVETGGPQIV